MPSAPRAALALAAGLLSTLSLAATSPGNPNVPLDRPYSLQAMRPLILEGEHHRMLSGEAPFAFIFPRPCAMDGDTSRACPGTGRLRSGGPDGKSELAAVPVAGYEYRRAGGGVQSAEAGLLLAGSRGGLSAYLDARMYAELRHDAGIPSFDREAVDDQDASVSGTVGYTSFSRYRSNLSLDLDWGRFTAARDAAHWGPGLLTNLVFHRDAVPFDQLTFTTRAGPLRLISLYGSLQVEGERVHASERRKRSLYAHRYELTVTRHLLLGLSEQLVVHGGEEHFAFVPIVPLFVLKGGGWERLNNGSLAVDAAWRVPGLGAVYSEFLIDDMQAPTSLFDDQWGNKWAWMAGLHLIRRLRSAEAGLVIEHSRVEPWVYTHYEPASAQSANLGYPLGNQAGPDSRSVRASLYTASARGASAALRSGLEWKGRTLGSGLEDIHPEGLDTKEFLSGENGPKAWAALEGTYPWGSARLSGRLGWNGRPEAAAGIRFAY